jgi:hypothetical protein
MPSRLCMPVKNDNPIPSVSSFTRMSFPQLKEFIMLKRLLALALLAASLPVQAGRLLDLEIVDRATGQSLEAYRHRGRDWVAGDPGERYAVRLVNRTGQRVLVVLSVDGVNAVSGETAAPDQSGYVLEPWERAEIAGWRKSLRRSPSSISPPCRIPTPPAPTGRTTWG